MTRVEASPGVCGFTTTIIAEQDGDGQVKVTIDSDCDRIQAYAEGLTTIDPIRALYAPDGGQDVACRGCHRVCLVPVAMLKAVEAEAGLALKKDGGFRFVA